MNVLEKPTASVFMLQEYALQQNNSIDIGK
jgi:hypothetical protein